MKLIISKDGVKRELHTPFAICCDMEELEYEMTRGMLERELDESLGFRFVVPLSKHFPEGGVVFCEFRTRPLPRYEIPCRFDDALEPRLRVVK